MDRVDSSVVTLTVGQRCYTVRLMHTGYETPSVVTVSGDAGASWTFEHAPTGTLHLATGLRGTYLWTDRQVVELPGVREADPTIALDVEQEPHVVFQLDDGWLLVFEDWMCRLADDGRERARLNLPDVVMGVSVTEEGHYRVELFEGAETVVTVDCEPLSWSGYPPSS